MALLSTLVKAVADVEGLDETQVSWIARHIREAGLITQAGRGRGAAQMTATDAAILLIGVNASKSAKDAPGAVNSFLKLAVTRKKEDIEILRKEGIVEKYRNLFSAFEIGRPLLSVMVDLINAYDPLSTEDRVLDRRFFLEVRFERPIYSCAIAFDFEDAGGIQGNFTARFESSALELDSLKCDRSDIVSITGRTISAISASLNQ